MEQTSENLSFRVKKTVELSNKEIDQLVDLVRSTMNEEKTRQNFKDKYLLNTLGFSFHALMLKNENIVGCNTVIPQEFEYFGKKYLFGQWCETHIAKDFRGMFSNFKKLGNILNEELLKNKICFIYGLPNRALYVVSKRLLGMRDIGKLNYYTYPLSLNKFLRKYYPFNILLQFLIQIFLKLKFNHREIYNFHINKINNQIFKQGRYFEKNTYQIEKYENIEYIYKKETSEKHNKAEIVWIIDVSPLNKSNLEKVVNLIKISNKKADLIIYIGDLKSIPYNLIKIPDRFIDENNIFSGKILNEELIDEKIFNNKNWNINSSNFDYK
tara:strand:- start:20 stop:997 length:978 start_codon:yes stop_codon:yes gene_type:complete